MLCSVYTTIAGEYCDPGFCTPIGIIKKDIHDIVTYVHMDTFNVERRMNVM